MSCEQNEPVRCVLRLFGASALGVQQAASAFPPEWCVTAQCRSRGAETLIALRSENAAGLDKARRSLHGCFAADLYGEGDTNLAAAVVQALEHRRRLLVCADAAAGALMEARLEAVPGAEKVFDFGTQSYADPKVGAQIARRAARRQDAAAALARVQAAQHLVGAELSAGHDPPGSLRSAAGPRHELAALPRPGAGSCVCPACSAGGGPPGSAQKEAPLAAPGAVAAGGAGPGRAGGGLVVHRR